MQCNVCTKVFEYITKYAYKIFWSHKPKNVSPKEIAIKDHKLEEFIEKDAEVASVAPCGDVTMDQVAEVLASDVEDYDSWNGEVEIWGDTEFDESLTRDCSRYTTAELEEAILEDKLDNNELMRMSKQSEKDIDSINESFDNSCSDRGIRRYLETSQKTSIEQLSRDFLCNEKDIKTPTPTDVGAEINSLFHESYENMRMVLNISEESSITTTTAPSTKQVPAKLFNHENDFSTEGFGKNLKQLEKYSLFDDEVEDERVTESQSTQTEEVSSNSGCKSHDTKIKKKLWTKRRTRSLARWYAGDSRDVGTRRPRSFHRSTPLMDSILKHSCCKGLRPMSVMMVPTSKRKKEKRALPVNLEMGDMWRRQKWPPNSLINTSMCGSFRIVEQPKMRRKCDYGHTSPIAIPFLFGLQSTNVNHSHQCGASENTGFSNAGPERIIENKKFDSMQASCNAPIENGETDQK